MKLWAKDQSVTHEIVEQFTVGRDREFDLMLAQYDVQGSLAHTQMLAKVGLLSSEDWVVVQKGLLDIQSEIQAGQFEIESDVEDVHSQIELLLTRRIGEAGKKIHAGRSRNDQVAVDIKLFLRAELSEIKTAVLTLFEQLLDLCEKHKDVLLPGYTHLQVAMPSSFGLWFGAWAESLVDDMELLVAASRVADKNPLGSGAGYGSAFPLDRTLTTGLLGFRTMHFNAVNAQMSRGKTEKIMAMAMANLGSTLARFSMDICLYLSQNFNFISFPPELTTGSSIMPHKKNPDIFELIRAKCNRLQALPNELSLLLTNLPSGYHRDLQLTKEILFPAIGDLKNCLAMMQHALQFIEVRHDILHDERYRYLFSVEAVNELVAQGASFREAYKTVGNEIEVGNFKWDASKGLHHTHEGSMGKLCTAEIRAEMRTVLERFQTVRRI
ncbi:MAG: argininosuccinate lyase [Saprospiraceae bacterium]|nr:argininosuccinate lyase [Saprospiraceae bacterium]